MVPVTNTPPVISCLLNNDKYFDFELDTGPTISVINEVTAKKLNAKISPSTRNLITYGGTQINSLGEISLSIQYGKESFESQFCCSQRTPC